MNFETDDYFKALVDSLPDMVWSFDRKYILTAANVAFFESRQSLYQSDIKTGDNFFKDVSSEGVQKWKPFYEKVLNGERIIMEDTRINNGHHYYVEVSLNPVYNDRKEVTGCMGITHDVTRLYEQDFTLNKYREHVNKLIGRTEHNVMPAVTKILLLSDQLNSGELLDKNDHATILFMINNELAMLNKELSDLMTVIKK